MLKTYFSLTKPGMVRGNAIAAAAGFFLASKGHVNWEFLLTMLLGISLVIASACVFNNYIDRDIDARMKRTKKRALVAGLIPKRNALIYATILGLLGITLLTLWTNLLTASLSLFGFFCYVVLYGIWKRRSVHGTLVGSISGSIPLVVGYCAVTNRFDIGAVLLFLILMLWQMPHFYAIALYRVDEYTAARLPVLPVQKGAAMTKKQIVGYILAFILVILMLTFFKFTGYLYLLIMLFFGLMWLALAIKGFTTSDDKRWGRSMFRFSLLVLLVFCVLISTSSIITK